MEITAQDFDQESDAAVRLGDEVDPGREDSYWRNAFARERYFTPGLDYEDYAPAYCVGYIGHAQYGGSFEDAEKSLCANWERIRGDSRLSMEAALLAMRAAWDRMANRGAREHARKAIATTLLRRRMRMPSFKLSPMSLR
jgi:hypothetical protein